jgi:hypothetical protein
MVKMLSCDFDALRQGLGQVWHGSSRVPRERQKSVCQVPRFDKGSQANIAVIKIVRFREQKKHSMSLHIDHELLIRRPYGGIETLPGFNARAKTDLLCRGREEISVLAHTHTSASCVLLKNEVQGRNERERVVIPSLRLAT